MTKLGQFEQYFKNCLTVKQIEAELEHLEHKLDKYDILIKAAEEADVDSKLIDDFAIRYNELDTQRIKLELRKNKIERDIILFEYEATLDEQDKTEKEDTLI